MIPLNAIVLCNDEIAIPALLTLAFQQQLKGVAVPARNMELIRELKALLPPGIRRKELKKADWKENVKELFEETGATIGFLMTFPWKLDKQTIDLPSKGFYNFHYGPLPEYRGADPLFYQIRNREQFAGLAVHQVEEKMDEGRILIQEKTRLDNNMTYGSLRSKLSMLGAGLVSKCMEIFSFSEHPVTKAQDPAKAAWYDKPGPREVTIDWQTMEADSILSLINACNPWNKGAATRINGIGIKIIEAEKIFESAPENLPAGQIFFLNSGMLKVACKDGSALALKIIYTPDGFMSAYRLMDLGIKQGDIFD